MIKSLTYNVSFPTTGRTFKNSIDFEPGLTAITGANEAGKSLVLEFIRYAWFGKSALRGKASDYKNLSVYLTAMVKGQEVFISREPKEEKLLLDGKLKAVGAEAINSFVPSFLGFGLAVHDIALTALQDNLHALTDMRPTARRAMIDQLTGTNALEAVEKQCRTEARENNKVAEALISSVVEPEKPKEPENLSDYKSLIEKRDQAYRIIGERNLLLKIPKVEKPSKPEKLDFDIEELQKHESIRQTQLQDMARLEGKLSSIPKVTVSSSNFIEYCNYREYVLEKERRGPKPEYSNDQLEQWLKDWSHILNNTTVECPKCGTEFEPDSGSIIEVPQEPPISRVEIFEQQRRNINWSEPLEEVTYDGPEFDYETERSAQAGAEERLEIQRKLAKQQVIPDRSTDLQRAINNEREWTAYETRRQRWQQYQEAQTRLETLGPPENLLEIEAQISNIERYFRDKEVYDQAMAQFVKVSQQAMEKQNTAKGYEAGTSALKAARLVVKQELVPSLSKAASFFVNSLTDGERQRVIIDQDFNIMVDNQSVDTLSGSGKAVVNLALRIALAQVLTSQVLSLFMGDEIDGSMDSQRAEATHVTFRNITRHLDQVILVTHKQIDADHTIVIEG